MLTFEHYIMDSFKLLLHWLAFFFTALSIGVICFGFLKSVKILFTNPKQITPIDKAVKKKANQCNKSLKESII